jgi:hypothetical protein
MFVTRKTDGYVVGRDIPEYALDLYLAHLPRGVYDVETREGLVLKTAIVKGGRVVYQGA